MKKITPTELARRREVVKKLHGTVSHRQIALALGVSPNTIMWDCRLLKLTPTKSQQDRAPHAVMLRRGRTAWTPALIQELTQLYAILPAKKVAARMGLRITTVRSKLRALRVAGMMSEQPPGVRRVSQWTPEKDALLRERWATNTDTPALALELEVLSVAAVYKRASMLDLKKAPAPKPPRAKKAPAKPERIAPTVQRGAPPMTAAQIAPREQQRITYPPDQLPWKARVMWGTTGGLPDLSHRSCR